MVLKNLFYNKRGFNSELGNGDRARSPYSIKY